MGIPRSPNLGVLAAVVLLLLSGTTHAQHPALRDRSAGRYQAESRLVLVPVTVTDRRGAPVTGLKRQAFTLMEDKVPQAIQSFSEQNVACSIGIIFDVSESMKDELSSAKAALRTFFDEVEPGDEALLIGVSATPSLVAGFTEDFGSLLDQARMAGAGGSTALVDALYLGVQKMRRGANPRKALLVVSDGLDNHSRYSRQDLMTLIMEAGMEMHTLVISPVRVNKKPVELVESASGVAFLKDLADRTGGLHFVVGGPTDMEKASRCIGRAMRNQYVLGYSPAAVGRTGQWHRIRVKMNVPETQVSARRGYYAR